MSDSVEELMDWLDERGVMWRLLRKPELLRFFARWREAFEPQLQAYLPTATDIEAIRRTRECLPADVVLFWIRGYEHTPADSAHPAYALEVEALAEIDPGLFNAHETIVADQALTFTCMFTHEAGSLAEIEYWDRSAPGTARRRGRRDRT